MGNKTGIFLSLEGPEGGGKSTHRVTIEELLTQANIPYVATREPGGTKFGEAVRNLVLSSQTEKILGETEVLMMYAARLEHVVQLIKPALARGVWVVCDRFSDSSFAYQGGGRDIPLDRIRALHQWCLGNFNPDLTLVLDVPVDISLQRIKARGALDRFESEDREYYNKVRNTYLELANSGDPRYSIIDANRNLDQVRSDVTALLQKQISAWQLS